MRHPGGESTENGLTSMIEAMTLWNEPNNLSHWDFEMDPWAVFGEMPRLPSIAVKKLAPGLTYVLGGILPVDANFIRLIGSYGALDTLDAVEVHGFPLGWNHWQPDEWPDKVGEIEAVTALPVWVSEVEVSSFGAEEVQVFGLQRTQDLLGDRVEGVFWYSLFDLPPVWGVTTRHKESEGSAYYRHFYMGLIGADGTPKPALDVFDPAMGICQWFHYNDPRLDEAVHWLKKMGVRRLRTGISWADWHRPDALTWFDRQMEVLRDFDLTLTLCSTPPSRGRRPHPTSPPVEIAEFAEFSQQVIERYVLPEQSAQRREIPSSGIG